MLSGLLAVGYTDGQIYVLKINISDPSMEPMVVSVHSESDLMRISCLSVVSHPEVSFVHAMQSSLCAGWFTINMFGTVDKNKQLQNKNCRSR